MTSAFNTLRGRLALLVLLPLAPALGFSVWLLLRGYQEDLRELEGSAALATRTLAYAVDQRLNLAEATLRGLSKSSALRAGRFAEFHAEAGAVAQASGLKSIALFAIGGHHLLNTLRPWGEPLPPTDVDAGWQHVFKSGQVVARLSSSPLTGEPIVAVALPVDLDGRVPYALVAVLPQAQLQKMVEQGGLDPAWVTALLDTEHVVAARSRDPQHYIGRRARPSLDAAMATQPDGQSRFFENVSLDGLPVQTLYSRGPVRGWTVVVGVPRHALQARVRESFVELAGVAVALLGLALLLDWWLARRLGSDVDALLRLSRRLGDPGVEAPGLRFVEGQRIAAAMVEAGRDLAHARDALERKTQALQQFGHAAAHDLHAPLRTVRSLVDVLQSRYAQALGPSGQDLLARAGAAVDRLHRMTRDLLMFAMVDRAECTFGHVDLGRVVSQAQAGLQAQVSAAGAEVEIEPLPTVQGEPGQLLQLFTNLLANALRFRGEGPCRIRVGAAQAGDAWRVWVMDTGIGIAPEHLEQVFGIFSRLGQPEPAGTDSTGIGLALCRRIVEHHGGRIWVESQPGQGSTFFMTFPQGGPDAGAQAV